MASFRRSLFPEIWHTPTAIPCTKKKNKTKTKTKNNRKWLCRHKRPLCDGMRLQTPVNRMNLLYSNVRLIQPVIIISKWYYFYYYSRTVLKNGIYDHPSKKPKRRSKGHFS